MNGDELVTVKQAMAALGISRATLWRLTKAGRLKAYEVPGVRAVRYKRADITDYVKARDTREAAE